MELGAGLRSRSSGEEPDSHLRAVLEIRWGEDNNKLKRICTYGCGGGSAFLGHLMSYVERKNKAETSRTLKTSLETETEWEQFLS